MYQDMHKWDLAIKVAELKNHPDLVQIKETYHAWLVSSGQEDVLGQIKEQEQDYVAAITIYLKGGIPGKAAQILLKFDLRQERGLIESTAKALFRLDLFEKAGDIYSLINEQDLAFKCYQDGGSYRKAIEICRSLHPDRVMQLEERWGDDLLNQNKVEEAINHFIEAGQTMKALRAAISGQLVFSRYNIFKCFSSQRLRHLLIACLPSSLHIHTLWILQSTMNIHWNMI